MMSSATMATARSSAPLFPPKKIYKGDHTSGVSSSGHAPTWHRGPTKGHTQQINKKVSKSRKPRRPPPYRKRRSNNDYPKHNVLLHRLSLPSSSPSGTLLERIGGLVVEDEVALTDSDPIRNGDCVSEGASDYSNLPFSTTPHFYTPEPGEVERFLESVIGVPPSPPSPSPQPAGSVHACLGNRPTLALETRNLLLNHLVEVQDPSSSVLYSPTQTAVNSVSSASLTLDHCQQSPLLGDTMPPPSPATLEECRKHLVPVFLASAQARDPAKRLDSEQCARLLSDDHCKNFFRQAKEMRLQLSSLVSQKTPVYQGWSGSPSSLKRDRADDVDTWVQRKRTRLDSANTVVSDVSRKDSDITLVDFGRGRLPPRAPRAMLLASQGTLNKKPIKDAQDGAPNETLFTSIPPTTEDRSAGATSLIELVHQAIKMLPALVSTDQPVPAEIDTSNVPVGTSTGDPPGDSGQIPVSATHAVLPSSTDSVSRLPTQSGIWFRQQGRQHAEIVDVDIDVSDEMFYMSRERVPFGLRVHLRLCSVPVSAVTENNSSDTPVSLHNIDGVIERQALHWPKKGKLVVQVNPESERSKTWLPYTLETDPLDVTSCMRPGKNTFRFIQLSDLSEFTFVLTASPPPPEEEWRSWDWGSLVERSNQRSSSSVDNDDPMNGLSEFAHIPITLQS